MAKRLKGVPNLPFAPIVAALFGLVSAILVFATPAWLLERLVTMSGISSIFSAAQPPLGDTARTLIAVATGLGTGLILWLVMRPIEKAVHARRMRQHAAQTADASEAEHMTSTAVAERLGRSGRAPIFAGHELGAPLMSDEALASGEELLLEEPMQDIQADYAPYVQPEAQIASEEPQIEEPLILEPPAFVAPAPVVEEEIAPVASLDWSQFKTATPSVALSDAVTFETVDDEEAAEEFMRTPAPIDIADSDEPISPAPQILEAVEPVVAPPVAAPAVSLTPVADVIAPDMQAEPSLRDLLNRLDVALERRAQNASTQSGMSPAPAPGTIASLRSMIAGGSR